LETGWRIRHRLKEKRKGLKGSTVDDKIPKKTIGSASLEAVQHPTLRVEGPRRHKCLHKREVMNGTKSFKKQMGVAIHFWKDCNSDL